MLVLYWRRRRPSFRPVLLGLLVCALAALLLLERSARPTLLALSEARAFILGTEAMNRAINEVIIPGINYRDLIYFEKDDRGRIVLMEANTMQVNRVVALTTLAIQDQLKLVERQQILIPLGQLLGSQLFADVGPRLAVRVVPIGVVDVKVTEDFREAGINQTRHLIYLEAEAGLRLVIPFVTREVYVSTKVPVTTAIIVGEVPLTYVRIDRLP